MNVKPGDLAFIVVPADWPRKTLDGKVVEVMHLRAPFADPTKDQRPTWWCKFPTPWMHAKGLIHECPILDSWLRPISGVPVDDETPIATDVPEAVKLVWGIEAPVLS